MIPKSLREELGVSGPADLELIASDGRLELTVADVPVRVEQRDGLPVFVTDRPMKPMTVEDTRAVVERTRR